LSMHNTLRDPDMCFGASARLFLHGMVRLRFGRFSIPWPCAQENSAIGWLFWFMLYLQFYLAKCSWRSTLV